MDNAPQATDSDMFVSNDYYRGTWDETLTAPPGNGSVMVIMKNPSRPDSPNVSLAEARRMGNEYGFSTLCVVNLFARRSSNPSALNGLPYALAVHESNDAFISMGLEEADLVVAAWGAPNGISPRTYRRRVEEVVSLVGADSFTSFGITAAGHPRHCQDWRRRGRGPLIEWSTDGVRW